MFIYIQGLSRQPRIYPTTHNPPASALKYWDYRCEPPYWILSIVYQPSYPQTAASVVCHQVI